MEKNGMLGIVGIITILLVIGLTWFVECNGEVEVEECVKVKTTCCPCSMGGEEKCVLASEVKSYRDDLSCSDTAVCPASYNCEIESCENIEGVCIAV